MDTESIRNETEHRLALARLEALMEGDPAPESAQGKALLRLAEVIEAYEREHFPFDLPDPIDAILFRMEQQGLTRKDLEPYIGGKGKVSEVLNRKRPLTLTMIQRLHEGLGIPADVLIGAKRTAKPTKPASQRAAPELLREMLRLGYFEGMGVTARNLTKRADELIDKFFGKDAVREPLPAYARSTAHYSSKKAIDPLAYQVWRTKVLRAAAALDLKIPFDKKYLTDEVVEQICRLSGADDGPRRAVDILLRNGIAVVIEPPLPKTYLDGAALLLPDGRPVIALTLRHDRLDNFWHTLLHELRHVLVHLSPEQPEFMDDLEDKNRNGVERDADEWAAEKLLPQAIARILATISNADELRAFANFHGRGLAVVAGRVGFLTGNYARYSRHLGRGTVKPQFSIEE